MDSRPSGRRCDPTRVASGLTTRQLNRSDPLNLVSIWHILVLTHQLSVLEGRMPSDGNIDGAITTSSERSTDLPGYRHPHTIPLAACISLQNVVRELIRKAWY